jgi:NTE family protein
MGRLLVLGTVLVLSAACAAPLRQPVTAAPASAVTPAPTTPAASIGRPPVGVAFGGGSARGIAHVGVIRWFEEHRIPIDLAAGTSMGGLIGGSFATGMDADELAEMVASLNWDMLFGASSFEFKNIRRKADARDFPSRLEFGLKRGIVPPTSLNNGEQVDLLLGRITAPYYDLQTFDDLPTPFRAVAVDLISASEVVIDHGSLAAAMRATMSLPLIFPPVDLDGRLLVDGGAMNNVPADVVRAMGAERVVAVNVGDLSDREAVSTTMLGLAGATLDAMMRASTREAMKAADVVINVPLTQFGSLDWRRSSDLIEEGYRAAESMRDQLLPLAVSEAEYAAWLKGRDARRRSELPQPAFVTLEGFGTTDARRMQTLLARHVGVPLDSEALQEDLAMTSGLDRYETVTWHIIARPDGERGILVRARPKTYAPPFLMLGLNLENTTSDDFNITLTGRYLTYDLLGSGSELRLDGTLGSDPALGFEYYRPIWSTALFVAPYGLVFNRTLNVIDDDAVIARYGTVTSQVGVNIGANLGRESDVRLGVAVGRLNADIKVGDPGLPSIEGKETVAKLAWRYDGQDSPVIPSGGTYATSSLRYVFDGPEVTPPLPTNRSSIGLTQMEASGSSFWTHQERGRPFAAVGFGTSFDKDPLPTDQFAMGRPLRLGAYDLGELRGDHYYAVNGGYLYTIGRLPDFMGGPIYAGGWLELGDSYDDWNEATLRANTTLAVIMETIVGPVLVGGSAGFDGRWRTYIGVGRILR